MAYLLLKARKKIYHGTSAIFKKYAKTVTDHPGVYCIVGLLIAALACVGIPLVKVDVSLDTVWMEENSRFIEEQNIYVENFGNLPRLGVSVFSQRDGSNIITKEALTGMEEVLKHLYAFDSPDVLKMEKMIDGKIVEMKPDDFCERPMLPDTFKPTDPTDPYSYVRKGAYQSYGYVEFTKCVTDPALGLGLQFDALPDGWGIEKAPCMRVTVLDCFKEGGVDYPDDLKLLEKVGFKVGIMMEGIKGKTTGARYNSINQCFDKIEAKMKADMDVLDVPDSAYNAARERYLLETFTWLIFTAFGYDWKYSIHDFKTDQDLVDHVRQSLDEQINNPNYGIENCIMQSAIGGIPRCCTTWAGSDVGQELYMGQKIFDENSTNKWTGVKSVRNPVVAQPSNNPLWVKEMKAKYGLDDPVELENLIVEWENKTIHYLNSLRQGGNGTGFGPGERYENVQIDLHTDRSTSDMAVDSGAPEMHLLILGAALMFLYSFVVMGSFSNKCINSNILTMIIGMIVSGLAVVGSSGILGFIGVPAMSLSVLVQLAGFILCIGNIYILMFTFNSRLDTDKPVEDNMVATIEFGGHAIFVITATLLCGFLCGVYVPIPGFRSLCVQMVAICLMAFLLQMFIFVPAMVWNCKRTQDNRMDCIPVKRQDGKPPKKSFLTETKDLFKNYPTIRHSTTKQSLLSKFANAIYGPIILNKVMRLLIIAFFIIFTGGTAYVTLQMTNDGLMMSDVAKPGSYQASFAKINEEQFEMYSSYIVTQSTKYASDQQQNMDVYDILAKNDWLVEFPPPKAWDWLADGMASLTGFSKLSQEVENKITQSAFVKNLDIPGAASVSDITFISQDDALFRPDNVLDLESDYLPTINASVPLATRDFRWRLDDWLKNIGHISLPALSCINPSTDTKADCRDADSTLVATRTGIYMKGLRTHENMIDSINAVRNSVDDMNTPTFKTFVYGFIFGFWGLYVNLRQNLALLCGCILVGIVIPITIFHCSLNAAFLIALCMIVGIFQVFGSFWMLGINFNGFSLVPLVLSIAIVVQHSIFVIHSFIGLVNDRKKRAKKTLSETFPAVFSSVFSLFILIVPLAFTSIPFIRNYICFVFLSVSFTAFNIPLLLLPCILSLMGPRNFDSGCEDGDESESEMEPTFMPAPLATNDFKQQNNYTRLTLRSQDTQMEELANRQYDVPQDRTNSPI